MAGMWKSLVVSYVLASAALIAGVSIDDLTVAILFVTLPGSLLFPLLYNHMYNWRLTWIGQSLMVKGIGLAGLLSLAAAVRVFGEYPGRRYFVAAFFIFVFVGTWSRSYALFQDRQGPAEDPEADPDDDSTKRSVTGGR